MISIIEETLEKYDELIFTTLTLNTAELFVAPQNNQRINQILHELDAHFDTTYEKAIDEEDYDVIHLRWRNDNLW